MRRPSYTTRAHARGLRPLRVFTGRDSGGSLVPPVQLHLLLRWSARAASVLVLGFMVAFLRADGLEIASTPSGERLPLALLAGTCLGLILAWRWEGWGGAVALVCLGAFFLTAWATTGSWPAGAAFPVLALPGALFVLARLAGTRRRQP